MDYALDRGASHCLGLLHTFDGGCSDVMGDFVNHTVAVDLANRSEDIPLEAIIDTCPIGP